MLRPPCLSSNFTFLPQCSGVELSSPVSPLLVIPSLHFNATCVQSDIPPVKSFASLSSLTLPCQNKTTDSSHPLYFLPPPPFPNRKESLPLTPSEDLHRVSQPLFAYPEADFSSLTLANSKLDSWCTIPRPRLIKGDPSHFNSSVRLQSGSKVLFHVFPSLSFRWFHPPCEAPDY